MLERWRAILAARWADRPPRVPAPTSIPKPMPPALPPAPDLSFAERFRVEWARQWSRPVPTRDQIEEARAQQDAALRRAQEDALIRDAVRGHGVIWRSDREGTPNLRGFGRMQSFEEYGKSNVLEGDR